jgi:hypothetical protein
MRTKGTSHRRAAARAALTLAGGVLCAASGAATWAWSARAFAVGACAELSAAVSVVLNGAEGEAIAPGTLQALGREVACAYFGAHEGPHIAERLTARAVCEAMLARRTAQHDLEVAGLPIRFRPVPGKSQAQSLAIALVQAAADNHPICPVSGPGAHGEVSRWQGCRGPAMTLLTLADALDVEEPLAKLYLQRAFLHALHPQAVEHLDAILLDLQAAGGADEAGAHEGLRRYLKGFAAKLQGDSEAAAQLILEALAAGMSHGAAARADVASD